MEPKSKEWWDKYETRLGEKFKFLMTSTMKKYEIKDLKVVDLIVDPNSKIHEIGIDLKLDYDGACDGEASSIGSMLRTISDDVSEFFWNHVVDPISHKFSNDVKNFTINDPFFYKIDYRVDELHYCEIYMRIDYDIE